MKKKVFSLAIFFLLVLFVVSLLFKFFVPGLEYIWKAIQRPPPEEELQGFDESSAPYPLFAAAPTITNPPSGDPPTATPPKTGPPTSILPKRVALKVTAPDGIGYKRGYETLEFLFAPCRKNNAMFPMVDLRLHYLNTEQFASNLGVIGRYVYETSCGCRIIGLNAYYDYREACLHNYNKLGVGFEYMGCWCDFRVNGYLPVGVLEGFRRCTFDYPGGFVISIEDTEVPYAGCNFEFAWHLANNENVDCFLAANGYYLESKRADGFGMQGCFHLQYRDNCSIEFLLSKDPIFDTRFQIAISFAVPFYELWCDKGPCRAGNRTIYQPVRRFEIIPVKEFSCTQRNF